MIIDIVISIILIVSMAIAFFRGFIKEVLTVFGLIGAAFMAFLLAPYVEPTLYNMLHDPNAEGSQAVFGVLPISLVAKVGAYGGILILFIIALSVLSHFLSEAAEKVGLGALDRTLGLIFGFVRGVVLIGLLYLPFHIFMSDEMKQQYVKPAATYYYLDWTAETLTKLLPDTSDTEEEADEGETSRLENNLERLMKEVSPPEESGKEPKSEDNEAAYEGGQREIMNRLIEELNKNTQEPQQQDFNE